MTHYLDSLCAFCGKPADLTGQSILTTEKTCGDIECVMNIREYANKKDEVVANFVIEKERLLKPWLEKMNSELFLLERQYKKFQEIPSGE